MIKSKAITLRVEPDHQPNHGVKLEDVAEGMVALAKKMDIIVLCCFNKNELRATPYSETQAIVQSFHNIWISQGRIL